MEKISKERKENEQKTSNPEFLGYASDSLPEFS